MMRKIIETAQWFFVVFAGLCAGLVWMLIIWLALSSQAQAETLFFTMKGCPPCEEMKPIVESLAIEGYDIRAASTDEARRWQVRRFPTFINVETGQRHDGSAMSREDLLELIGGKK